MVNLRWIVAAALFGSEFSTVSVAAISADAASIHLASRQAQVQACTALLGDDLKQFVFYPTDAEYAESLATYYSGSVSAIKPSCIFRPDTPNRVALAVSALTRAGGNDWAVAVRGGGHAFFPAANNVNKGVVIDLSKMNSIQFTPCTAGRPCQASNPKGGITSVGPGARWGPVYAAVEKYGMTVAGGREAHVGVSGLLLGGGFSFHAGRRGLSCDNVVNYQVVTADGNLVEANKDLRPDLFKALKGGSNNLAIVTRFDLDTWPDRGFFGGITAFAYNQKDAVVDLFVRAIDINRNNPDDSHFLSISWTTGAAAPNMGLITASVDGNPNSTTFAPIANIPSLINTRASTTYSALTTAIQGALGKRNVWYTLSFDNTRDMMDKATNVFDALQGDLAKETGGSINLIFVFQPLSKQFAEKAGINILGLDTTLTKDAILFQAEALFESAAQEELLRKKLGEATATIEAYAKSTKQNTPFRYLNYAHPSQDPIGSYGAKNVALLKSAAAKYDPKGFFQKKVSGGFKL